MTNTQTIVDAPHKDLRRARAASAVADPDDDRLGDRDRADLPRARGQARRPRRPRAAAQRLAHRLRLRGRAADDRRGGQRPARRPRPTGRSRASSATRSARWSRSTSRTTRARRSSTRPRRWSSTARRSRSWPGTTTSGATRTGWSSSPRTSRGLGSAVSADAERHGAAAGDLRNYVARHRRLLGRHDRRRRDPRCSSSSTSTSSATAPFEVASLFLFYEVFGIVTNLVGGWLAARLGLKATLLVGLGTQLVALGDARRSRPRRGSSCPT